jgi:threonine dehydrogenase-like Zn-dependent dehydrogenase
VEKKLRRAAQSGAGKLIAVGTRPDCVKAVTKNGGNIAMLNVLPEVETFGIPTMAASSFLGHKTIKGGLCPGGKKRMERLLSMVEAGRVDPGKMITHKFKGLQAIEDAFLLMADKPRDLIKPIVYFEYND